MSRRSCIKPAYCWGAMSNTEPPDDDFEDEGGAGQGADPDDLGPDDFEHAAELAQARYEQLLDARASQ